MSGGRPERWGEGGANGDIAGGRSGLEVWWFCEKKMREREREANRCAYIVALVERWRYRKIVRLFLKK